MPRLNSHGCPPVPHGSSALTRLLHAWIVRPLLAIAREQRGATAIFVAVAIIPLVGFLGLAVDTTRGYLVKSRLGTAVDAAALAGGRIFTSANRDDDIQMYFRVNFPDGYMNAVTEPLVITADNQNKKLTVSAQATIPTTFMSLVGIESIPVATTAEVTIESQNVEVSLVLDLTGSMAGQRTTDLKAAANELVDIVVQDDQSLFYSKVAIVPYSQAVNAGPYAPQVRGVIAPVAITNIENSNPAQVTTATPHGLQNGDKIYITGVSGMTQANNNRNNTVNGSNPKFWIVDNATPTQFTLKKLSSSGSVSVSSSSWFNYTQNGTLSCLKSGCTNLAFQRIQDNEWDEWSFWDINSCVTERVSANVTTDAAPSTTVVGPRYQPSAGSGNDCISSQIQPLTSDKTLLHDQIDDLQAGGSTGGQIGVAWGWYLLSPTFDNPSPTADPLNWTADSRIWPAGSHPAPYGTPKLMKVVIIMTDGEYNSVYYNGVIAKDSTSGSGPDQYKINHNSNNGNSYTQAQNLCAAMKAPGKGIIVYTVGLNIINTPAAQALVNQCATSPSHVYLPETGAEMQDAFRDIALKISKLRLSK